MLLQFIHKDTGKTYTMEVTQALVCTKEGNPVALAYDKAGMIVYTDAGKDDFDSTCAELMIKPVMSKV